MIKHSFMEESQSQEKVHELVTSILKDYQKGRDIDKMTVYSQPDQRAVREILKKLLRILYPGYYRDNVFKSYNLDSNLTVWIEDVIYNLNKQIGIVLRYQKEGENPDAYVCQPLVEKEAAEITMKFMSQIPKIREYLDTDLEATLEGDPAALNKDEIVLSYPGLLAITVNRIAHELFLLDVPLIPRMMTEYAHSRTGIDIHPGATIGKYFFIDHGTGIVVGSTTTIGEHVKVYQGVTLGALSTSGGQKLRGHKRHPTIEDHVTIYSGASILGGETVIGANSVIGSNAFITSSIPAGTRVTIKNQELQYKKGQGGGQIEKTDLDQDETWFYVI
ncbi:serine O-acetyltransferase EpsC [Lachnospiraceae bacterium YH-ros2228]|jgi:serine O-acetyltransferase|nr:serine acetyltransferase [Lachnospiraceae bacterium]MDD6449023.1 serine acetyltransferase [Lachnospiraceae bacterium]MDD6451183.1 serine acetyltransferase [Lachnospiraceae bacterium]MDD6578241.1 serine acetyltransferase [Lachnospiraceae bacterium]